MEQLVARRAHNPKVTGSSPVPATINVFTMFQFRKLCLYRGVEQLVARRAHNPKATGSSPVPATN